MAQDYKTAAEHRAHIEGAMTVIDELKRLIGQQWLMGRDNICVQTVRDALIEATIKTAKHVAEAQHLENLVGRASDEA